MQEYCNNLTRYLRLKTLPVKVGNLVIGNLEQIRLQTMTTTDTMKNKDTVAQIIRCIDAGADLVRVTAPSIKEATHLQIIRKELEKAGYYNPICADIHFTPKAAEIAARIVQKVRVNPGNYVDKKKQEFIEYTDATYNEEIERIREKFLPLIKICKEYGTAMRIGTNHGSLSDRIMSRYGDTPLGMVESALEFLRICQYENYHQVILSMKASNPLVMVQAYRLLVQRMISNNRIYPLHLGVTEAGDGEEGRIKSAIGIGTLLEDGIGDTIRVSLTEDPELELPVCKHIIERYNLRSKHTSILPIEKIPYDPYSYQRHITLPNNVIGGTQAPIVISDYSHYSSITHEDLQSIGYKYDTAIDKWTINDMAADFIYTGKNNINFDLPGTLKVICNQKAWWTATDKTKCYPIFHYKEYMRSNNRSSHINFVIIDEKTLINETKVFFNQILSLHTDSTIVWVFETDNEHAMPAIRRMFMEMMLAGNKHPKIIKRDFTSKINERTLLHSATDFGGLLIDGMGDGIWMTNPSSNLEFINRTCFNILQATRTRICKTEYISCPSCGRTLFDLQYTTAAIKSRTHHLKGVKIAIMGCIVNGPGEMADADFGYVGSGIGKITLYKGKEIVKRNIDSSIAVDELINLLKENNVWVDPE